MSKKLLGFILFANLFLFPFHTTANSGNSVFCGSGGVVNKPPIAELPTYDYGSDGLVRFHFKMLGEFSSGGVPYIISTYFDPDCSEVPVASPYQNWHSGSFYFPNVSNLMLKAEPNGSGAYHFVTYNEDTGKVLPPVSDLLPVVKADAIVGLTFVFWPNSNAFFYNEGRTEIDTPKVSVTGQNFFNTNKTPILIIPGVLGTDINKGSKKLWFDLDATKYPGDEFMDPLAFKFNLEPLDTSLVIGEVIKKATGTPEFLLNYDYTKSLIDLFTSQDIGYKEDKDLFTFPYDWRYGVTGTISGTNITVVNLLQQKIQEIMAQTGANKVDVIAHSTGGLILKKYVIDNQKNNPIGKVVFLGVPNLGAPKAFKALISGDSFGDPFLADLEMKKISQNMPVVYDLAPSPQYYSQVGSFLHIHNPFDFPENIEQDVDYNRSVQDFESQHLINNAALINSQNLHTTDFDNYDIRNNGVDVYNIVGCKAGTFGKFTESIQKFSAPTYDFPQDTTGDGTVPLLSAQAIPADPNHVFFAPNSEHGKLPSADGVRQQIVNILTGSSLSTNGKILTHDDVQQHPEKCQIEGEQIKIKSPVAVEVTDQDGNFSGLADDGSIQNDIPGVDYEVWGEHKYVFLPTDEGQTYSIKLKGTGNGTFTFDDQSIDGDNIMKTQVFSNLPVTTALTGQVNLGSTTTLSLDNNGDGVVDQTIQPSSIINADQSEDLIAPVSTSTLTGLVGQAGFYRSNVNINLSAIDPVIPSQESQTSGVLKTQYSLDGGDYQVYSSSTAITVSSEGQHTVSFFSTDRAGNNEQEQTVGFTIDKTAPEFVIQFNNTSKDLDFIPTDTSPTQLATSTLSTLVKKGFKGFSKQPAIKFVDSDDLITATDAAGNVTKITLKDKDRKRQDKAEIKSISYNDKLADVSNNKFAFDWLLDKKSNLLALSQHVKSKKDFNVDAIYLGNKTVIIGKDQNGKVGKNINGLVLLKVSTDKGDLSWSY